MVKPKRARDLKKGGGPGWPRSGTEMARPRRAGLRGDKERPRALMPMTENLSLLVAVPTTLSVLTVKVPQEKAPPTRTTPEAGVRSSRHARLRKGGRESV